MSCKALALSYGDNSWQTEKNTKLQEPTFIDACASGGETVNGNPERTHLACERRRISGGRFSPPKSSVPPEIRLCSQARTHGALKIVFLLVCLFLLPVKLNSGYNRELIKGTTHLFKLRTMKIDPILPKILDLS